VEATETGGEAMSYEYTLATANDLPTVQRILSEPKVWRWVAEDGASIEDFRFDPSADFYLIVHEVFRDGPYVPRLLGMLIFQPRRMVHHEIHVCLLPVANGSAAEITCGAIDWMFEYTRSRRITAGVPDGNLLALKLARDCGLVQYGYNPGVILQGKQLIGETLMGISKE